MLPIQKQIDLAGYEATGDYRKPNHGEWYWNEYQNRPVKSQSYSLGDAYIIVRPKVDVKYIWGDTIRVRMGEGFDTTAFDFMLIRVEVDRMIAVNKASLTIWSEEALSVTVTEQELKDYLKVGPTCKAESITLVSRLYKLKED